MDILQAALIFSIIILSVFLSLIGVQVFLILRGLKKTLDRFSRQINYDNQTLDNHLKDAESVRPAPIRISRRHASPSRRLFKKMR